MSSSHSNLHCHDTWAEGRDGRLFVRIWQPKIAPNQVPIVLFHDSLGCVDLWRGFPAALCAATQRRVIAYDRLGFGRSDAYTSALSFCFIDDEPHAGFATLCDALHINEFIALGHSVGGCMAVHCAAAYGGRCLGLITLAAQAFNDDRVRAGIRDAQQTFEAPEQFEKLTKYHGGKARWVLNAWVDTWLDPAFTQWSLAPALAKVSCPALILHGEHDEYGSLRQPERIAQWLNGPAHCEILAKVHHVPHREDEAQVVHLVQQFITELGR